MTPFGWRPRLRWGGRNSSKSRDQVGPAASMVVRLVRLTQMRRHLTPSARDAPPRTLRTHAARPDKQTKTDKPNNHPQKTTTTKTQQPWLGRRPIQGDH